MKTMEDHFEITSRISQQPLISSNTNSKFKPNFMNVSNEDGIWRPNNKSGIS